MDRLKISHSGKFGMLLIAPKYKEDFMRELSARSDHLEYINGEVVMKR